MPHAGGRLFQQYVVDAYCKIEAQRLDWVEKNQDKLRTDTLQGLLDFVTSLDATGARVTSPNATGASGTTGDATTNAPGVWQQNTRTPQAATAEPQRRQQREQPEHD